MADRGLHRGHRGRPGRGRARLRAGAPLDLRHPRRVRRPVRRRDPRLRARTTGPRGWSASGSVARRSACRGRSSSRTSSRRGPRVCTACRTPARPPGRRRSGTRSASCRPSGSATAPRPPRTRRCSRHLAETGRPARGLPVVQHRHPGGGHAWRSTRSGRSGDAGVTVTVNSDDPPMFGTTLNREYAIAADLLGLDEAGVADLARTAVRASFAPDGRAGAGARRDRRLRRRLSRAAPAGKGSNRPRNLIRSGATTFVTGVTRRGRCGDWSVRVGSWT